VEENYVNFSYFLECLFSMKSTKMSQVSSYNDWATGWTTGFWFPVRAHIFSSPLRPDRFWAQPASYWVDTRDYLTGLKRPGREADHSPPSSVEGKKAWSYTSILYGVVFSQAQDTSSWRGYYEI
jgi:hypothetical protein